MTRVKTKKSKTELEGEKWVKDKIVQTIAQLRDMVQKLEKENKDLVRKNEDLEKGILTIARENRQLNEYIQGLRDVEWKQTQQYQQKIVGLKADSVLFNSTAKKHLTKIIGLEAQIRVLREIILELFKNK